MTYGAAETEFSDYIRRLKKALNDDTVKKIGKS
jgi:hypothetical protein